MRAAYIKQRILKQILEGHYQPNEMLPSVKALCNAFNASPNTVQKAIHGLSADGVLEAKRGTGLFVKTVSLRQSSGKRIGLIHPSTSAYLKQRPYPGDVLESLEKSIAPARLRLEPCSLAEIDQLTLDSALPKMRLSGIVLFEVDSDPLMLEIREMRLPMVSMDYDGFRHGISSVVFNNAYAGFLLARHLIELGHTRIAFLRPLLSSTLGRFVSLNVAEEERLKGFEIAIMDAKLPLLVRQFANNPESIGRELEQLLNADPASAPTAVACTGDWLALIVANELQRRGLRIPRDISLAGFGNSHLEYAADRFISSVHLDPGKMGEIAGRLLLATINGEPVQREVLPVELALYDSTARCPKAVKGPVTV